LLIKALASEKFKDVKVYLEKKNYKSKSKITTKVNILEPWSYLGEMPERLPFVETLRGP